MSCNSGPELSRDEWENMLFGASDVKIEIMEPETNINYEI